MLKRTTLIFTITLLLVATAVDAKPPVRDETRPLAVIAGPTSTPAGELVEFDAGGSTGAGYDWAVSGSHNTTGRWKVYETGRILVFASPEPGNYLITLSVAVDGQSHLTQMVLHNGVSPDPDPDPDIDPGGKWQVAIVYETNQLDNLPADQQSIIKSLTFRKRIADAGHRIVPGGVWDKDAPDRTGSTPKLLAPYLAACKNEDLPRLCISPVDGGTIRTFALPANSDAVMAILEGARP